MILLPALDKSNANETALRFWYSSAFVIDQVPHAPSSSGTRWHAPSEPHIITPQLQYLNHSTFSALAYFSTSCCLGLCKFWGSGPFKHLQRNYKKSKERKLKILSPLFSDCMFCGKNLKTIMSTEGESASQMSCLFYYLVKRIIACESPPRFRRTWKYFVKRCRTHQ